MNLPIYWLGSAALPAAKALQQSTKTVSTSISHMFGEMLQPKPSPLPSGRSEQVPGQAPKPKVSATERLSSIKEALAAIAKRIQRDFGIASPDDLSNIRIVADGKSQPSVVGPEQVRIGLENFFAENPDLVDELNQIARESSQKDPLALLPNSTNPLADKDSRSQNERKFDGVLRFSLE